MTGASPQLKGRQVLILSSVDWESAWQRHQALADQFLQAGSEVFFIENTGFRGLQWGDLGRVLRRLGHLLSPRPRLKGRTRSSALRVVAPLTLPPTEPLFRALNSLFFIPLLMRRLKRMGLKPGPLALAYLPTATTLGILDAAAPDAVVYDCVDNFYGHPSPPDDLRETEEELLRRSALVLTTSQFLYEAVGSRHPRVLRVHHGVSEGFFLPHKGPGAPCRRLCYFGTVWSAVDFEPLKALADAGFEVTLIGPVKELPSDLPDALRFLPPVEHADLPETLAAYDALLLPYADTPYNQGVIPAKIYECLATGKPVLASPLPSLRDMKDLLYLVRTPQEFVRAARALSETESAERVASRVHAARAHATSAQFKKIAAALGEALRAQRPAPSAPLAASWAESLLRGFTWIALFFAAARALTLLAQFLAAHYLGPSQYGSAHLIIAVASFAQILPMLGFPLALARHGAAQDTESGRRRIVSTTLTSFALWAGLCLAVFIPLSPWLAEATDLGLGVWKLALFYGFATAAYQVASSSLQGLGKFKDRGAVEALYSIASMAALALLLASGHRSFQALIHSFMLGLGVATVYGLWLLRRYARIHLSRSALADILPFALLGSLHLLAAAFVQGPGRIAVYHLRSPWEAGVYSVYFTATAQVALALVFMANTVIVPLASRPNGQQEAWALLRSFRFRTYASIAVFFAACASGALFLLRESYPVLLFALSGMLIFIHGVVSAVFAARDTRGLLISVSGALAAGVGNLVLNLVLTPRWGIGGAASSLLIGYLLGLGWYLYNRPKESA